MLVEIQNTIFPQINIAVGLFDVILGSLDQMVATTYTYSYLILS